MGLGTLCTLPPMRPALPVDGGQVGSGAGDGRCDRGLTDNERQIIVELMPHLIQESPRTQTAGFKVATILGKLPLPARAALKRIMEEVAIEAGKKAMGF